MKKLLISILCCLSLSAFAADYAKFDNVTVKSSLTGSLEELSFTVTQRDSSRAWRAVASSADGKYLVAAALTGYLYTSVDYGVTWVSRDSVRGWYAVASSADGANLVAAESSGKIYTSTDYGTNWVARDSNRTWYWLASSADGKNLAATVFNGKIYTSVDAGTNWAVSSSVTADWYRIASSSDGTKLVACVSGGYLYTSVDAGTNWTQRESTRYWFGVASSADGTKLFATGDGGLYRSVDAGTNWVSAASSVGAIACSADGTRLLGYQISDNMYSSEDSGVTWVNRGNSGLQGNSIACSSDGKLAVMGEYAAGYLWSIAWSISSPTISGFKTGSLIPSASNTYDIGSAELPYRDLYVGSNSVYMDGVKMFSVSNGQLVVGLPVVSAQVTNSPITEAPIDGLTYGRLNGGWNNLASTFLSLAGGGDIYGNTRIWSMANLTIDGGAAAGDQSHLIFPVPTDYWGASGATNWAISCHSLGNIWIELDNQLKFTFGKDGTFTVASNLTVSGSVLSVNGMTKTKMVSAYTDSITGIVCTTANGLTNVLVVDTANKRVGVGKTPASPYTLDVNGAGKFAGNLFVSDSFEIQTTAIGANSVGSDKNLILHSGVTGYIGLQPWVPALSAYGGGINMLPGGTNSVQGLVILASTNSIAWDDMLSGPLQIRTSGPVEASWNDTLGGVQFTTGSTTSSANDHVTVTYQSPHRRKSGTDLHPHVHFWQTNADQTNMWYITYAWSGIGQTNVVDVFMGPAVNQIAYTPGTTMHQLAELPAIPADAGKTVSTILRIKLWRNGGSGTGSVTATDVDCHYQIDSFGSDGELTKSF